MIFLFQTRFRIMLSKLGNARSILNLAVWWWYSDLQLLPTK